MLMTKYVVCMIQVNAFSNIISSIQYLKNEILCMKQDNLKKHELLKIKLKLFLIVCDCAYLKSLKGINLLRMYDKQGYL